MPKNVIVPWKQSCTLRSEIRTKVLTAADFAVDIHRVIHETGANKPLYCDPDEFFKTTYATPNLRRFCADVLRRLAGQPGGEAIINVAQTFGGGKSHTLTTLFYTTTLGSKLNLKHTAIQSILAEADLKKPPQAVVAAVSFDKVDWKVGGIAKAPDGTTRYFRMPWNLIAWQLLGQKGLDILKRDEAQPDFDTPPADTLWREILDEVEKSGKGALILMDEFLMWAHDAASPDPTGMSKERGPFWYDRLKNFFQRLSQAVEASQRSALVVSLLATDPALSDDVGKDILSACNQGLNRMATVQSPVEKGDLAELLRRRMFEKFPENPADREPYIIAFWDRMKAIHPFKAKDPGAEDQLKDSYPFHPDLLTRFFGKWTELKLFQRTRGVLQTFALALRDAEKWDNSPLIGPQIFLAEPGNSGLSAAMDKLAEVAKDSNEKNPQWPTSLKTEMPRVIDVQKSAAATLTGRELEAACVAAFIFSQPIKEQAELSDLRWLLGPTCDMPAVLNNGLIAWAKTSWYLEETDAVEAGTNVPKYWRLGPLPNLNQVHDSYKKKALTVAKAKFDELAKKCKPLTEGIAEGVQYHNLPDSPSDVDDDGQFRLAVLGSDFASVAGGKAPAAAEKMLRTHSSDSDTRNYQNVMLVVIPSQAGLQQGEQQIADWIAWQEIMKTPEFPKFDSIQQERVKKSEKTSKQQAETAVKNAYELVLHLDKVGSVAMKKFTMGAQALFPTLLQEKDLRLFRDKIDAAAIMPGGLYNVWPSGDDYVRVRDLFQAFGSDYKLPKMLSAQSVYNTIADAVERGLLAARCPRPDGSEQWFWRTKIDVVDWEKSAKAWLPQKATVKPVSARAVLPESLPGLWPGGDPGVELATVCGWFDGTKQFQEVTQPGYPAESRPVPKAAVADVHTAVAQAVKAGDLWLVFGNDSVCGDEPSVVQLDDAAKLYQRPAPLNAIDLLPGALPDAWTKDAEPTSTVAELYAALKKLKSRPWPSTLFMNTLKEALGQGVMWRSDAGGVLVSLAQDGAVKLVLKNVSTPPPPTPPGGRMTSKRVNLSPADIQNLSDEAAGLAKTLAGCDVQFEVAVTIKAKPDANLTEANKVLEKIKPGWTLP